MFSYQPLDRDENKLRFIRFAREPNGALKFDVPITLELRHAPMDQVQYTALSYVWGDMTGLVNITINGSSFAIGRNLHAGLEQMRRDKIDSWIWVDSICIQQSNNDEKSWLVERMRSIYKEATLVYMWLGKGSGDTDRVLDFVARVGPKALAVGALELRRHWGVKDDFEKHLIERIFSPQTHTHQWTRPELAQFCIDLYCEKGFYAEAPPSANLITGMREILSKNYWNRIWIIQEVALARMPLVACGEKSVALDALDATFGSVIYCQSARYNFPTPHEDFDGFAAAKDLRSNLYAIKALEIRQQQRDGEEIRLIDILFELGTAPGRPFYSATDPRDIAFALFGLVLDKERVGLLVDYNKTTAEIFAMLTRVLLISADEKLESFHLDCCEPKNYHTNLPTWVPDWERLGKHGYMITIFNYEGRFNATPGMPAPTRAQNDHGGRPMVLRRPGCTVDLITDVMEPPDMVERQHWGFPEIKDAGAWLASILDFVGLTSESGPGEDYVWRTIMFDNPDPDLPPGPLAEELAWLIRRILRRERIEIGALTTAQVNFVRDGPCWGITRFHESLEEKLEIIMKEWPWQLGNVTRGRTLFKTAKGMLGLGHVLIQPGDSVNLLWGVRSLIVLRPRGDEHGFYLMGDAYVDGIMQGEFLRTNPAPANFDIH